MDIKEVFCLLITVSKKLVLENFSTEVLFRKYLLLKYIL